MTKGEDAISNHGNSVEGLAPCTHEEADTWIFVHVRQAAMNGSRSVIVKANDTDVVVIAVSAFTDIAELGLEKMWIAFGQGVHARMIPVHEIVSVIGPEKASGLPFFHAFTGCDVVSAFRGKAKKSAWQTWNVCNEVSATFTRLSQCPTAVEEEDLQVLERFVVVMYDRSSAATGVNDARLNLFARKQRPYDGIPPTKAALKEHAKRAAYQAGIIWGQATLPQPDVGTPANWGWVQKGEAWQVCWTTLPPIVKSCQELAKCSCNKNCSSQKCKCFKFSLVCTPLCSCVCQH